jgi:hypothetical protein
VVQALSPARISTHIHKFAQTFFAILIDAENSKIYLPFQIEPEEKNFTVQAGSSESLTTIALPDWTGELKNLRCGLETAGA